MGCNSSKVRLVGSKECAKKCVNLPMLKPSKMDICSFRDYCLSLPLAEETLPFDENTLVFKIGGKIFAAAEIGDFRHFAVKCDPDEAILLRDRFPEIRPPKYFNKRHWNFVSVEGDLSEEMLRKQIEESFRLVIEGLSPKAFRQEVMERVAKMGFRIR